MDQRYHAGMVNKDSWIAVYIMASRRNGTLYTGVTSQLIGRVLEPKRGAGGLR